MTIKMRLNVETEMLTQSNLHAL